jgi:catechol 2,3-dioxygenase-like lactoylglutathione lyase family enzyme
MTSGAVFHGVNLVVADIDASVAFYRRLGVDIPDRGPWDSFHRDAEGPEGTDFEIDSAGSVEKWNAGSPGPGGRSGIVLGFNVASREEVDRIYADLTGAGHGSQQAPHDAFWGSRYAVVEDPDGYAVGFMSPASDEHRSDPSA